MLKALSDQAQHLVTRFDNLDAVNLQMKAEMDNMRAVIKQLNSLNARQISQPVQPVKAIKPHELDTLAPNASGSAASKYAPVTTATKDQPSTAGTHTTDISSESSLWVTVAKRPIKTKSGVLKSERKRLAAARAFNAPTPVPSNSSEQVYEHVYIPRSRRLNRSEIRQRFRKLGIDTTRILDINFPAPGVLGVLVHKEFTPELVKILNGCKVEPINSFDPCDAKHIADPKYANCTALERANQGRVLQEARCIATLKFIRPYLVTSVAHYFVDQKWMQEQVAIALIAHRVPRPLKRRTMDPQAVIDEVLNGFRPRNTNTSTGNEDNLNAFRQRNAHGQPEAMHVNTGEEFAENAYGDESDEDNTSDMESEVTSTPTSSSQ